MDCCDIKKNIEYNENYNYDEINRDIGTLLYYRKQIISNNKKINEKAEIDKLEILETKLINLIKI